MDLSEVGAEGWDSTLDSLDVLAHAIRPSEVEHLSRVVGIARTADSEVAVSEQSSEQWSIDGHISNTAQGRGDPAL